MWGAFVINFGKFVAKAAEWSSLDCPRFVWFGLGKMENAMGWPGKIGPGYTHTFAHLERLCHFAYKSFGIVARTQCAYEIFRLFNAPKDNIPLRPTHCGSTVYPLSSDIPKFPLIKNVQKKSQSNRSMHNNGCVLLLFRKHQKKRCSIMPLHWEKLYLQSVIEIIDKAGSPSKWGLLKFSIASIS